MADDGFLGRWSRRKAQARSGALPVEEAAPPPTATAAPAPVEVAAVPHAPDAGLRPDLLAPAQQGAAPPPPPTLDDVAQLTPQSDFSRFVAREVAPDVKNAALKKLFADPHFNVMDGLDIYIDDYSQPDPVPLSMLRQMTQSKSLGLFDDEEAQAPVEAAAAAPVTQLAAAPAEASAREGTDLPAPADEAGAGAPIAGAAAEDAQEAEEGGSRTHPGPRSGPTRF